MSDKESDREQETQNTKANILDKYANRIKTDEFVFKKSKTSKDKSDRATVENVLDPRTIKFLEKLYRNGTITKLNGCISTGKEANVYHAVNETNGKQYAIKIYKTSVLIFKDRERYVDGEFRFRNTKNQHNPRKMIKIWAEKEFRNLKRLHSSGLIPTPEPVALKSHVLCMEFLTENEESPSPKLKDYQFKDTEEVGRFYQQMLVYMRIMFQKCHLIHADLSEYNSIVHKGQLYIFDVSQSVEPDHPMSLDFLRMDIKNVNDYFQRKIQVYPERLVFQFIVNGWDAIKEKTDKNTVLEEENEQTLFQYLESLPLKGEDDSDAGFEDDIFRSMHLVRSLNNLEDRDFQEFADGKITTLNELVQDINLESDSDLSSDSESESDSDLDAESDSASDSEKSWEERDTSLKGKRFEDKDEKKARKQQAKELKQDKRKTKMKKHLKKKLIRKTKK
ncbi:Serine kinase [Komagataella phaffii CBS 7435]|uniref:Serine/threonine-protein kinase RIO1 n=2 Tax=Komagataella phaffii TaxID=460519 RepID=C4R3K6_KOMPG|nr:Essential serine kinase involved in cell cycle progression and processing of the 20S pre-rRNA into m [Komagataella phaffii GS115]AOA63713.1 GQ67_03127T0 [Komagataella phaffii]CAH2450227.1 Serine kinase [Komagataella phaffii CBS 7435]AOA68768.1 GQ68_03111T0 [Komagataella phaffii GS115]CAY70041.1 Essential serine kinase involved in cell cycle progression and processing of the 20S pre-rRNA into m [Komagataella phaffii GS115]CCA40066.1 Serine kinase [Komagataella phaffii CBS 7435]